MKKIQQYQYQKNSGFTIIELIFATTIFSVILLVCLGAFIQIGRLFYKGVNISHTQEAARSLLTDISDDLRLSKSYSGQKCTDATCSKNSKQYFCVGNHRYVYQRGKQYDAANPTSDGLVRDSVPPGAGCPSPDSNAPDYSPPGIDAQQLLSANMAVSYFCIDEASDTGGSGKSCNGSLANTHSCTNFCTLRAYIVLYGTDNEVFMSEASPAGDPNAATDNFPRCSGPLVSTQFCATADLVTNVLQSY